MFHPFILNPFPALLTFGLVGATILRVVVGVLFIRYGYHGLNSNKKSKQTILAWLELIGGALLVLGLYTQIAALILFFLILHTWTQQKKEGSLSQEQSDVYVLLLVICLSLLITGAGFFGFDLPL